ncbi:MAG: hypothetical protein B7733_22575 [Myxococcales bacterium FL481]|nr:MAG: hypothetical protein B7733_22575 [Myxococcales bacterium FL481]
MRVQLAMADPMVIVIGAGPVGLAAAAQALARGLNVQVFERGDEVGRNIVDWGHIRLFSPWRYLIDDACSALLEPGGWRRPDPEEIPLGHEFVQRYLRPLAEHPRLRERIHTGTEFVQASLQGFDKVKGSGRQAAKLLVRLRRGADVRDWEAGALIDASGVWQNHNPLGANGLPALGEAEFRGRIHYGSPDVLGTAKKRYVGRRTAVVGGGHTAANVLLNLLTLAQEPGNTEVLWVLRGDRASQLQPRENDQLPARGALGNAVADALAAQHLSQLRSFRIQRLALAPNGRVEIIAEDGRRAVVDEIIASTGQRPQLEPLRELRLEFDPILESTPQLAPHIDPNEHSCGDVKPHGWRELRHPQEPDVYVIGAKSYGRAPTFLMATGYEQARSVVAAIDGDIEAADRVELVLPQTGVCGTGGGQTVAGCC